MPRQRTVSNIGELARMRGSPNGTAVYIAAMSAQPEVWSRMADEAREVAGRLRDPLLWIEMLRVAASYAVLAQRMETLARRYPFPDSTNDSKAPDGRLGAES